MDGRKGVDVPIPPPGCPQAPEPVCLHKTQGEHGGDTDLGVKPSRVRGAAVCLLFAGLLAQRGCCFGDICSSQHPNMAG